MIKEIIAADLKSVVSDLLILADHQQLKTLLESESESDTESVEGLMHDYLLFSKHKQSYDQIRYLDETGMEIVRVNYNSGHPGIVAKQKLQNKAKRYYFKDTFSLAAGEVFVSPLDLNIEHGQIEQPLKPIIRLGTPVTDSTGRKRGIVLINYLAKNMLDNMVRSHQGLGSLMLLNADGYFLKGLNPKDEWGFMYEDRKDRLFVRWFPEAAAHITAHASGLFTDSTGMFSGMVQFSKLAR